MQRAGEVGRFPPLGPLAGLAASYFLLAHFGLRWATVSGAASPVFPAAGVALAGLVLGGLRLSPGVFVASLAATLVSSSVPHWAAFAIAAGNTLAFVVSAAALGRVGLDPSLGRLRDVLALVAASLGCAALSATAGTAAVSLGGPPDLGWAWVTWMNWWAGDATGALLVTPLVLSWARSEAGGLRRAAFQHLIPSTALAVAVTWVIFGPLDSPLLQAFFIFPVLGWAALAGGVRGAATAMVPVAAIAIWGTTSGYGPFAAVAEHASQTLRFVLLQQFVGGAAISTLVLAVVADERRGGEALRASQQELRRQAAALRENEERLRLALRAGRTGVWDWDFATSRVVWSEETYGVFGLAPGTFAGTSEAFERLIHPDDLARFRGTVALAVEAKGTLASEFRIVRPDGQIRHVTNLAVIRRDEAGRPSSMVGTVTDVTEQRIVEREREQLLESERAARTEAERASRLKDEFLSTVSHELRTPLNAILGWSHILGQRLGGKDGDLVKGITVIERNARAQTQLVEDLLDMGRIISGKLRLSVGPVDLHDVVTAAVATVTPSAEAKGIRLEKIASPSAGEVRGDPNRLQQVAWNLLSNAIKFTPKGGRVQVTLGRVGSQVQLSVSDTGQGIEPAFLPHVFDRFRQADGSIKRQHGGLGLGLAIVKNLVELHGGTVRALSGGEGQGATFLVELPISVAHLPAAEMSPDNREASAQASAEPACDGSDLGGISVLFVDDTADTREIVKRLLEECKARVRTAGSGEEALALLAEELPDILVSDIGIPGMDGYELIRRVRSLPPERGGELPAVALTALARSEDRTRALRAGFQTHLAKPVQPAELMAAIGSLASRGGRRVVEAGVGG